MIVSPQRCQRLLGLQSAWRQQSGAALEQVERSSAEDCGQHERRDPVIPAKEGVTQQEDYSENEHLHGQEPEHSSRDCKARPLADVARDLRELDAREMNLLPRQMRAIFRHIAKELPDSAIGSGCAQRFHR
jgi:hypothetical protein